MLSHLPRLLRLRRALRERLLAWRPDVFIGIDAPDFNLGVERWLKQRGLRTVHYVSPSVWAWREGRAEKIGRSADLVLCLFPMEPPIYARHGVDARFVGHPLADTMPLDPDRAAARDALELPRDAPVLALLPGSRLGEIERLGADLPRRRRRWCRRQVPDLHVVIPAATPACRAAIEPLLSDSALSDSPFPPAGRQCARPRWSPATSCCSRRARPTLEAMLAQRPMVVGYRIAPLTHAIVKRARPAQGRHLFTCRTSWPANGWCRN